VARGGHDEGTQYTTVDFCVAAYILLLLSGTYGILMNEYAVYRMSQNAFFDPSRDGYLGG
jgi:hypothetical protein